MTDTLTATTDQVPAAIAQREREVASAMIRRMMPSAPSRQQFEDVEERLLDLPQVDCPLVHRFAPGVYLREIEMPADSFIIGAEHRTEHFNIILSGRALVMIDGVIEEIRAPHTFKSMPGVRKTLLILETMRWMTVHVTQETDLAEIEKQVIIRTPADQRHKDSLVAMKAKASELGYNPSTP